MRHNGKVRLVLPLLVLVDLADVVVADEGGEDFGELDLGDILPGARIVSSAKLNKALISLTSRVSLFFFLFGE